MNLFEWSYPCYKKCMRNASLGISLNSSSGYESANNDSGLIEPCLFNPLTIIQKEQSKVIKDDSDEESADYESNYRRKKRRVLSHSQREDANRRERHRMEIINQAYERLRNVLPFKKGQKRQKMSRIDTVDSAIKYIQSLLNQLYVLNYSSEFTGI